jgi:hypothetical protein
VVLRLRFHGFLVLDLCKDGRRRMRLCSAIWYVDQGDISGGRIPDLEYGILR